MYYTAEEMLQKARPDKLGTNHPYLRDGTTTTSTENRSHALGGPSRIEYYMTELSWRIMREFKIRRIGFSH